MREKQEKFSVVSKILVTGATGYIGGRLVPRLIERGYSVRCLARDRSFLSGRGWSEVEVVEGDLLVKSSLKELFRGVKIAYYLVHSMRAGEEGFEKRDELAALNFAELAREAGVERIIYLGGLGKENQNLSPHLRSRQKVGEILRSSGVPVTEFRAAIIVGSGSLSFEMIRYLTERIPVMVCPRWVSSLCQPIAIRDLLAYLLEAIEVPESIGKILEIGGKDILSYRQMLEVYAKVRGLKRYLLEVPVLTPHLSSLWVDLVTPIPASMSRPLIEGLKNDVVCQNQIALDIFSIRPISYEKAVRLALERVEEDQIETVWSSSSLNTDKISPLELETKEGRVFEVRKIEVKGSPENVYKVFSGIGGERGWFYANWAWKLRGFLDRLVGGIGMRRGRRSPDELRPGDPLDFWRVEKVEPNHLLRLRAEMKVPGRAWLQFEVSSSPEKNVSLLVQTAYFEPKGLFGHLYWYLLYPIHQFIFSGLIRAIQQKTESLNKKDL